MINLIDSKWPKTMESRQIAEEFNKSTDTMTANQLYGVQMYGSQEFTKGYRVGVVVGIVVAVAWTCALVPLVQDIKYDREHKYRESKKN